MEGLSRNFVQRLEALQEGAYALTETPLNAVIEDVEAINFQTPGQLTSTPNFSYMFPERQYDMSQGWYESLRNCALTKYDRAPFIQRFWNIAPLCHEVLAGISNNNQHLKIPISSFPFMDLGGHACNFTDGSNAVFLNEGLLGSLPILYRFLMPLFQPAYFGQGDPNQIAAGFFDQFFYLSQNYITQLSHPKNRTKLRYPDANETWYMQYAAKHSLMHQNTDNLLEPNAVPLTPKQALFLACRGAFIFILGHEFAHIYANHNEYGKSNNPPNLREQEFLKKIHFEYKDVLDEFGLDESALSEKWFACYQVMEEQADALALHCVAHYIVNNDLDDARADCVFLGVAGLFILMEVAERLLYVERFGYEGLSKILRLPWQMRNVMVQASHPAPLSRLYLASFQPPISDYAIVENLRASFAELGARFNPLWIVCEPALPQIKQQIDIRQTYAVDRSDIFAGQAITTHLRPGFLDREHDIGRLFVLR